MISAYKGINKMKKYKITGIDISDKNNITVRINGDMSFVVPKNQETYRLVPGDTVGVVYDNVFGNMPMAYIYNGNIDMGVFSPCESMGGQQYVGMMKWHDRLRFNIIAGKNILANGKKPALVAWRNAQILAGIYIKNWKQAQGL